MKKLLFLSLFLSLVFAGQAQVSQTVNVTAGGGLSAAITAAGGNLTTITNLTVTGTIDASDFVTMRDNMPALAVLDISGATVAAYTGTGGTTDTNNTTYPANELPGWAFFNSSTFKAKTSLTTITLPNSITSIGDYVFAYCSGLTSITLPNSVTSMGVGAFYGCSGLTTITLPSSVTSIGNSAFARCSGLTTITLPNSITSIGLAAFDGCSGLTSITLPNSVTSMGFGAFEYCSGLTSITLPNSITSIGDFAFYHCSGLTTITLPNSITSIGLAAFDYSGLTTITLPNSITSIGDFAFCDCSGLTNVTIPSSVTSIGDYAFYGCAGPITVDSANGNYSSLNGVLFNKAQTTLIQYPMSKTGSYTIPSSVTSIGKGAFAYCSGLTNVTIPSSVTSIGDYAFFYCSGLTNVTIPSSVTSIGSYAFAAFAGPISVDSANGNYSSLNGVLFNKAQTTLIQSPMSKTGSYTIPSSVTSIGVGAFAYCSGLTTITLPNSVTSIGDDAFDNCSGLTTITLPGSVTSIGNYAFESCSGLTTITLPNSVTSIGVDAFDNCSGLTSITAEASTPIDLSESYDVFTGVPTSTCILYVPSGSVSAYQAADQWSAFTHIVEFTPATAISTATTSALKAYTQNGQLIVTGINQGEMLTVYTVQGITIYSQKTDGNQVVVNLPAHGIYILRAGVQSVKVVN